MKNNKGKVFRVSKSRAGRITISYVLRASLAAMFILFSGNLAVFAGNFDIYTGGSYKGTSGNDIFTVYGGTNITINALEGDDEIYVYSGTNILVYGNQGTDWMHVYDVDRNYVNYRNPVNVTLYGGQGDDRFFVEGVDSVKIQGGLGNDRTIIRGSRRCPYCQIISADKNFVSDNGGNDYVDISEGSYHYIDLSGADPTVQDKDSISYSGPSYPYGSNEVGCKFLTGHGADSITLYTSFGGQPIRNFQVYAGPGNDTLNLYDFGPNNALITENIFALGLGNDRINIDTNVSNNQIYGGGGFDTYGPRFPGGSIQYNNITEFESRLP